MDWSVEAWCWVYYAKFLRGGGEVRRERGGEGEGVLGGFRGVFGGILSGWMNG